MKHLLILLLCVAALARSLQAADPLPMSTPKAEGFDSVRLERVHQLVQGTVKAGEHSGGMVLIARHGRIVDWQAWGSRDLDSGAPIEKDTIFRIYSMSKVVTAVAVLQLFEQNKFNLDSPVSAWIPELADLKVFAGGTAEAPLLEPMKKPITVKMLLNHTAGFTYDFFSGSPVHDLYKKQDLWNASSLDEFIGRVAKLPLVAQPGVSFNYGISDDVLGLLIQRVSGESFENYVSNHITGPLRMKDTAFDVPPEKMNRVAKLHEQGPDGKLHTTPAIIGAYAEAGRGIPAGGAGLFSTIGDYARFVQMLVNGGQLDGVRILGRKTVELARINSLPKTSPPVSAGDGWGLFSAVRFDVAESNEPSSVGMFYWSGAATTHFFADPSEGLVALVFCQHLPFDQHRLFTRFHTAVYQALE
ncbi:MAG TPA: serine hydrolase domain-containing protein [Candidatus Limnocylindria bacterium]|jgi:CubicO group peptidase (beta-lactamase class C family)|nr:serine hydrolase domain-containing protein [Candidatus Limnocylindria bacterium]